VSLDLRHPLPGTRALVVGAARSGVAAARLLRRHGLEVTACDRRPEAEVGEAARALAADGVTCAWGRDDAGLLGAHEFLVWSPGIPSEHPLAAAARAAIGSAADAGDADTSDLFTGVSRGLDKALWFLEAHLQ